MTNNPIIANMLTSAPIDLSNNTPAVFKFRPDQWPDNAIHVSLDLETAGIGSNSAIVQLAAVTAGHQFNQYISLASCEAAGLEVSTETLQWWSKQDPELRARVFGGTDSLRDVMYSFVCWCSEVCDSDWDRLYLWGNGVEFDCSILINAIELYDKSPFNFRNMDHLRTLKRAVPLEVQEQAHESFMADCGKDFQPHDALGDAMYQYYQIKYGTQWLKERDVPSQIF